MRVKKYSGELVEYKPVNLRNSLAKSGANDNEVQSVFEKVEYQLFDGISTRKLYEIAYDELRKVRNSFAARYSLKKALRDLGPEGFYFEQWIAKIYQEDGYEVITGQTIQGHAVTHEIDVIALQNKKMLAIECKFRNDIDAKISVTTPMYFMSRLIDLQGINYSFFNKEVSITEGWLVTNANFTSDSIKFSKYHKMNLLSWDYPNGNNLKSRVDTMAQYPITCLTSLSNDEKSKLLKGHFILVKDIVRHPNCLQQLAIDKITIEKIIEEAEELITLPTNN